MNEQKWLIQTKEGRIFGPHKTPQVLELIGLGAITGDERIAEHPSGQWREISHHTNFYDKILEALANGEVLLQEQRDQLLSQNSASVEETKQGATVDPKESLINAKTTVRPAPVFEDVEDAQVVEGNEEATVFKADPFDSPEMTQARAREEAFKNQNTNVKKKKPPTIELASRKRPTPKKMSAKAILVTIIGLFLIALYWGGASGPTGGYVHLLSPRPGKDSISEKDLKTAIKKIVLEFQKDTFQGYVQAQNQLVGLIESAPRSAEALALLCLTHRELWPYSFQDASDLGAISKTAQQIAQVDPIGYNGSTCRVVQQIVNNHLQEAMSITDTVLQEFPEVAVFYEIKGDLLAQQKDFVTAISYVQKTQRVWAEWLKTYTSEGQYRTRLGQFGEAANIYRQILKSNPKHNKSKVLLGAIEFTHFQHPQIALNLVKAGLDEGSRHDRTIAASGYTTLGQIYEQMQNRKEALEYAKKAYALRPIDETIRALVLRLGGESALNEIKSNDNELVAMGDQYLLAGNFLAAQAQYKSAFEKNSKNALAALKAAQSLWKLNDSLEAIEWVQKAIKANPTYVEAHTTLAEYYVHRYDFSAAIAILQRAQKIAPKNYEVYRGYANLELTRNNFQGAVTFAKRALSNYDTDLESHLILVKAYRGLEDHREAYQWAARAIELDQGSAKAQSLYGEVLSEFQGIEAGIQYLRRFANTYPRVTEYKVTLAKILKKEERFSEAIPVLAAATSEDPNNKEALIMMAECLQASEKLEDARAYYLAAAALDPSDPGPLFQLGGLYLQFKKPLPAIDQFQRVLALNARYPRAHFNIGRAALLMNDADRALKEAEAEKKMNPTLADVYLLAGDARMDLKQFSQAINEFQRALKIRPQGAEIYVKLAKAYRFTSQPNVALAMVNLAILKESGYADIYKEKGAAHEMMGDKSEAAEAYARYLQIQPNAPDKAAIEDRMRNLGGY